nr:MAG TPA: hypothetical protein [Caudoviricetes sp.]
MAQDCPYIRSFPELTLIPIEVSYLLALIFNVLAASLVSSPAVL